MTQFRVINRETREEQVFNTEEIQRFFHLEYCEQTKKIKHYNKWSDYAVSTIKTKAQRMNEFVANFLIACAGLAFVVITTKIIMQWI
ncbi:MAG: hypothetical protein Unbinned579contig1003_3 [Prokaryotic dsDNA virus sp.]|nr:MAG: hypothetical protein Unbinned579contig1003_3 [Prokaryotic dsDNA virus sp.]|tara:strand:+ start:12693 stop:12953 length:261 start_codon:yes stop_codon:yes gene_type:complete